MTVLPTGRCASSRCRAFAPARSSNRYSRGLRRVRWISSSVPTSCCRRGSATSDWEW
uniref:Uncharacterized protein n=1 Tax=uncultured bacterium 9F08 TaxID=697051 RepID=D2XIS8_9BACT|nr:hypothetical protein [uncultured bacterium 9F08]